MLLGCSVLTDRRNSSEVCTYLKLFLSLVLLLGPSLGFDKRKYTLVLCSTKMAVGQPAVCQANLYSALPSALHIKFSP